MQQTGRAFRGGATVVASLLVYGNLDTSTAENILAMGDLRGKLLFVAFAVSI